MQPDGKLVFLVVRFDGKENKKALQNKNKN